MTSTSRTPNEIFVLEAPSRDAELFELEVGSLVAGAAADALGWVTEFMRSPVSLPRQLGVDRLTDYVGWRKKVGGRFNTYIDFIGPGEYSDDTQLTLSLARSIRSNGSVDHDYFAKQELVNWLDYARGAGRTITAAAKAMARARTQWYSNFFSAGRLDYRESGANGAAMRIAPIALANLRRSEPPFSDIFKNAITTHGHPRAHVGALAYGAAILEAARRRESNSDEGPRAFLNSILEALRAWSPADAGPEVAEWLLQWNRQGSRYEDAYRDTLDEFAALLDLVGERDHHAVLTRLGAFDPSTKGSGTATVAAALHLFCWHGRNIEGAVTEAVNAIPADTDTIGAMVGTLAGVYAGYQEIPPRWTARLQDMPYFVSVGESLTHVALGATSKDFPLRPQRLNVDSDLPDVMQLLRDGAIEPDIRVRHEALGAGWVQAIHAQEIRRRDGGEMIYARVRLDIGQTCQFRAYIPRRGGRQPTTGT